MINLRRWHEVDRIFAETLDRPPPERTAFLDTACAGDRALRREVERLLAADRTGAGFLERPPAELLSLALDEREEGGSLGPYRLLRRIGSGGMGTVYLARREDEHYQRDVAVKVLRSGRASTEAFHRFLAERQILAHLEHPNIARLYDGGSTEDGRPYLVMELIEGMPVDKYCDRHRLTVDQRLGLFQKVCAAVQYAHQNLLVHRDLKPANILITPEGEPKLLDFGIAKRLAPEPGHLDETQSGMRMLTPSYASPEQVWGKAITTASDVYSLGVILYELLAGRRPCKQNPERPSFALVRPGPPDAEEIASSRETRPSALARRLQGDLDDIVLAALRKDPRLRYGSAAQLSQDLERHLQDLPVTARPATLRYRVRKFARRHRGGAAATAAVLLLVAGSVASLVAQGRQLAQERDKARYALSFLVDTFKQADPHHTQGERLTAREILDQGADRISRELSGQPDVQAAVMDAIGEVNRGLGRYDEAEPLLERALALRRQVSGRDSLEVAETLLHLASLGSQQGKHTEAERLFREGLAIERKAWGDRDPRLYRDQADFGEALINAGKYREAEAVLRRNLKAQEQILGREHPEVTITINNLALALHVQGRYAESEALNREVLAIVRSHYGPRHWRVAATLQNLAADLDARGNGPKAISLLHEALEIRLQTLGEGDPVIGQILKLLAEVHRYQKDYSKALEYGHQALESIQKTGGPDHPNVAHALREIGRTYLDQRRFEEAEPFLRHSLDLRTRTLEPRHPDVGKAQVSLARCLMGLGRHDEAVPLLREARQTFAVVYGPEHELTRIPEGLLAEIRAPRGMAR